MFNIFKKIAVVITQTVFETRWGYVAYSYEDYQNLKKINRIFWKARANAARWNRWNRKDANNRVQKKWERNVQGQKISYKIIGPMPEPIVCDIFSKQTDRWSNDYLTDNLIEIEYQKSHRPVQNKEDLIHAEISSKKINELLIKAEIWYNVL